MHRHAKDAKNGVENPLLYSLVQCVATVGALNKAGVKADKLQFCLKLGDTTFPLLKAGAGVGPSFFDGQHKGRPAVPADKSVGLLSAALKSVVL